MCKIKSRYWLVLSMCVATLILFDAQIGFAQTESEYARTTVAYKKVDGREILADVHRPNDDVRRAVVVWIHGGALINGHREGISGQVKRYAQSRGHALISIDYRLAPETKLPEIITDIEDAMAWIDGPAADEFRLDSDRVVVTGGSAGGYLTLITGHRAAKRPRALLAFWGYGDLVGEWYSTPSPHPRHNRVKFTREQAFQQVAGPPVSDSRDREGNGGIFYNYCRQTGLWPREVSGWDPVSEVDRYEPFMPVRNVTGDYPPTFLIHGTDDTDVPFVQSKMMADEFERVGVEYQLASIEGGEHGLGGGAPEAIAAAYENAWDFLDKHLK